MHRNSVSSAGEPYARRNAGALAAPLLILAAVLSAASCSRTPVSTVQAADGSVVGHIRELEKYRLWELRYEAPYDVVSRVESVEPVPSPEENGSFGCTLFSASDASGNRVMGRNFDWKDHPILVLLTNPEGGYASVSVVDLTYPVRLLDTPAWPFDGMNERGLAIGMMAVDEAESPAYRLGQPSVTSFGIIRVILDNAATVDEALTLMESHFVMFGGNPIHYFIADRSGASAVAEFYLGELRVLRNENPWQVSTNFVFAKTPEAARPAACRRYAKASDRLSRTAGRLDGKGVFGLLAETAQSGPESPTIWSSSYNLTGTKLELVLGRKFGRIFRWNLAGEVLRGKGKQ